MHSWVQMKERNISRDWERSRHLNLQWQELKCRRPHGRQTLAWAFGAPGCRWKLVSGHAAQGLRLDGLSIIDCQMEVIYLRSGSRGPEGTSMPPEQVTQASVTPSSVTLLPLPQFTPMASCMWWAPLTSLWRRDSLTLVHSGVPCYVGTSWKWNASALTAQPRVSEGSGKGKSLWWIDSDGALHHSFCAEREVTKYKDTHGLTAVADD